MEIPKKVYLFLTNFELTTTLISDGILNDGVETIGDTPGADATYDTNFAYESVNSIVPFILLHGLVLVFDGTPDLYGNPVMWQTDERNLKAR